MATFAPPAHRGDFLYSSVLYADVGNGNQHPRASVAELAALLRPDAPKPTKKAAPQSTPAKDQVGHWYTAQLVHYGLPGTKDKNAAKVRLLTALNQSKLQVPAWIMTLEGDLKKEWEGENRKLKKTTKDGAKGGMVAQKASNPSGKNLNITVNVSVPVNLSMTDQLQVSNVPQVSQKTTPNKRKRQDEDVGSKAARKKPDVKKSQSQANTPQANDDASTPKQSRSKKLPAKKEPAKKEPAKKEPAKKEPAKKEPAKKGPAKKEPTKKAPAKKAPVKENTPKKEPRLNKQPRIKQEYPRSPSPRPLLLSGIYEINCPSAIDRFPHLEASTLHLQLLKAESQEIWWSGFTWGAWEGIMQMDTSPDTLVLGQPCSLGWRLRDLDAGVLKFGRKCTGEITLCDDQTLQGCLFDVPRMGTVEFWGERVTGLGEGGRSAIEFEEEWEGYVTEAYGH